MKTIKISLMLCFLLIGSIASAQKLSDMGNLKNTSETVVTSDMFGLIAGIDFDSDKEEVNEIKKMVNELTELRIYNTENSQSAKQIVSIANAYIKSNNLVKLMHVKEDGQFFTFHMLKGNTEKKVKELVMLIDEKEGETSTAVFLIIKGNLDLDQVSKITKALNVPGQKQIEDATQK